MTGNMTLSMSESSVVQSSELFIGDHTGKQQVQQRVRMSNSISTTRVQSHGQTDARAEIQSPKCKIDYYPSPNSANTLDSLKTNGVLRHFLLDRWTEQSPQRKSVLYDQVKTCQHRLVSSPIQGPVSLPTSPRLDLLLQGIKRLSSPRQKKQPLTPSFLRMLHRSLDISKPRQRLLWGSIVIGYFFLLRRSEFLKIGQTRRFYCLKTNNAFFSDDNGRRVTRKLASSVTIGLEGAKNDQFGRGAWRTMNSSGDKLLCPVQGLHHILRARKLLKVDEHRHLCASLTVQEVVTAIKNTARRIGVPAASYSSHSIRIGGVTALAAGGPNKLSIKFLGRWLSNCYEEYPRLAATESKGLSQRMIRPAQSSRAARK